MGNKKELILIHHDMKGITLTHSVNIMLTPEFYTLKKEAIPVKYAYQAKRIAPSLFEGLLDENSRYDYLVWKESKTSNEWTFIAYDTAKIAEFLASKGLAFSQVAKVFFAQQSLGLFESAMAVGEDKVLLAIDAVIVLLPRMLLSQDERPSLQFSKRFTPQKGVSLQSTQTSFVSLSQSIILTMLFMLFAGIFAFEGYTLAHSGGELQEELEALYEEHSSLSSSYTRKGILNKYQSLDKKERQKRDNIKQLSSMIFKGVTLNSLELNDKKWKATFSCQDSKVAKRVKDLSQKYGLNHRNITGINDVIIEGSL